MNVYLIMIVSILILSLLIGKYDRKNFIYLSSTLMFIVMGFRDANSIGIDSSSSYLIGFNEMANVEYRELSGKGEQFFNIGFDVFMKFVYELTHGNYQIFIMILSAIIMISFAHLIKRYSPSPMQSICYFWGLLYYTFMFSAEKQALSMAILVWAFDAAIDKKLIRFIVLVALATSVHFPALIFLPVYVMAQLELENRYLPLMAGALAVTYIFRSQILSLMLEAYGSELENGELQDVTFFRTKVIIMIIIVVGALFLRPAAHQNRVYKTLLLFMCTAIVFQTFCGYNNIFERLADYYFYFSVIFIPMVFEFPENEIHHFTEYSEKLIKMYVPFTTCSFAILRFVLYLASSTGSLTPYRFFF